MAKIRVDDCVGSRPSEFTAALAPCRNGPNLVGRTRFGGHGGSGCVVAAALVSRLSPVFDESWAGRQPVSRAFVTHAFLFPDPHAGGPDFTAGRKGHPATQTSARGHDVLATGQRVQPAGSAFLNRQSKIPAPAQIRTNSTYPPDPSRTRWRYSLVGRGY
jgi:hypothetical protein